MAGQLLQCHVQGVVGLYGQDIAIHGPLDTATSALAERDPPAISESEHPQQVSTRIKHGGTTHGMLAEKLLGFLHGLLWGKLQGRWCHRLAYRERGKERERELEAVNWRVGARGDLAGIDCGIPHNDRRNPNRDHGGREHREIPCHLCYHEHHR